MSTMSFNHITFIGNRAGDRKKSAILDIPPEFSELALWVQEKIASARVNVQKPIFDSHHSDQDPMVKAVAIEAHSNAESRLAELENILYFLADKNFNPVLEYFQELLDECNLSIAFRQDDQEGFFPSIDSVTAEDLRKEQHWLSGVCDELKARLQSYN